MTEKKDFFIPENENTKCRSEHHSSLSKYKLVVSSFSTREGGWSYTRGTVFKAGSDEPIAVIDRNYSAFPFSWIEDHPNGHCYLVAGEDYQGQTVIELDTGKRRDYLHEDAEKGFAFCWSEHKFDSKSMILTVCGCYWACPYEYRFFDFRSPMDLWPELELLSKPDAKDDEHEWVDEDPKWPEIDVSEASTIVRTFQTRNYDEDGDEALKASAEVRATKTFRRVGLKLILEEEWVSEPEKKFRHERDEAIKKNEAEIAAFRAADPLYLAYKEELKSFKLACDADHEPEDYESHGVTHENWCPDFKVQERRWCRRIYQRKRDDSGVLESSNPTIDFEWAVKTGPVKLHIGRDDKSTDLFYEHSVDGIRKAFARAREEITR